MPSDVTIYPLLRAAFGTAASLSLSVLFACAPPPASLPPPELEVEYGGCFALLETETEPVCVLRADEKPLTLWVESDLDARLEVLTGGRRRSQEDGVPVENGLRFSLTGVKPGKLTVRAVRGDVPNEWELSLAPTEYGGLGTTYEDVEEVRSLSVHAGPEAALRFLEDRFDPRDPPIRKGFFLDNFARLGEWLGHPGDEVRGMAEQAVALHRQAGNLTRLARAVTYLHGLLERLEDVEAARDVLFRQAPETVRGDGESAYYLAFSRGEVAFETGDVRGALRELSQAARHAERIGRRRERNMAEQFLARQLRRLGRHAEAGEIYDRLVREPEVLNNDCERAQLFSNFAWDRLLALEARRAPEIPFAELGEGLGLVEGCGKEEEQNLRLNLALAYLHAGDPRRAAEELARLGGGEEMPRWLLVWRRDVAGRIALAEGRPREALALYDSLTELAEAGGGLDVAWRAAVGRARALEAGGDVEAALEALKQAEGFLDEESLQAPVDGRETSVAGREGGTRLYLDLLVRQGRPEEALTVARRARSRFFRGLVRDQRRQDLDEDAALVLERYYRLRARLEEDIAQDWAVPTRRAATVAAEREETRREAGRLLDEALDLLEDGVPEAAAPPPVAPGELLLLYHPAPEGWLAFAAGDEGVDVRRLGEVDVEVSPAELAEKLLSPFADRLARAGRVRILPYGVLRTVDFHALPFGGGVLLSASRPVVYGLDLPEARRHPSGNRALLIADPSGSLRAAPEEVASVERILKRRDGWSVRVFEGDTAVLREELPGFDLLHFAGHADFFEAAALDSALAFDREGAARLTAGDVLAGTGVPAAVVLSACDSARSPAADAPVALGLAHAFLLAGGRVVVAAVRKVDDRDGAALVRYFYDIWDTTPEGAARALAEAQLRLRSEEPDADWSAFRVLER